MSKNKSSRQLKKENAKLHSENSMLKEEQSRMSLSLAKHDHNHIHNVTVSDLPSPEAYREYPEELQKLILLRIETDIENDKKLIELEEKEQLIRKDETSGEILLKKRGQIFAFLSLLLLSSLSIYFSYIGYQKTAGTIVAVTILGTITAFTGFGRKKQSSKK